MSNTLEVRHFSDKAKSSSGKRSSGKRSSGGGYKIVDLQQGDAVQLQSVSSINVNESEQTNFQKPADHHKRKMSRQATLRVINSIVYDCYPVNLFFKDEWFEQSFREKMEADFRKPQGGAAVLFAVLLLLLVVEIINVTTFASFSVSLLFSKSQV